MTAKKHEDGNFRRRVGGPGLPARRSFPLLFLSLLLAFGTVPAQEKARPLDHERGWRPAAGELLESILANRYETRQILALRPKDFGPEEIAHYRTQALTKAFKNADEEFKGKYTLFRYALARLTATTDDPYVEKEFKNQYLAFQDLCRCLYRKHAFANVWQEEKAEWVKDPYPIYRHFLKVYLDELALQLDARENVEDLKGPYTLAEDYIRYPNEINKQQLKQLYFSISQYFQSRNYTWSRYINKYRFQAARRRLFAEEWERELGRYRRVLQQKDNTPGWRKSLKLAYGSARFTYLRLKKEAQTNCLPYFSKVGIFYLSDTVDDYLKKITEGEKLEKQRQKRGDKKEVVIFIHGLGENRTCWGEFPELLALEDVADPSLGKYYHVYVFQYATQEKSKGVENFVRELAGFIDQIKSKEKVEKVALIGHSFGGVISLRYLVSKDPATGTPWRDNVDRFVGIAPSLHGSHLANVVVGMFGEKERKFERNLPPFAKGMPFVGKMGDLQIKQNQVGSNVNLTSFETLDRQKYLKGVKTLMIVGDPRNPLDLFAPGGRSEDDDLVKTFSANLNHIFLDGPSANQNIGYHGAEVRYADKTHFAIIKAMDRKHISYRYVSSFLKGDLLPQQDPDEFDVKYFLVALRVFPAGYAEPNRPFLPDKQRSATGELLVPGLKVEVSGSRCVDFHKRQWNLGTGVYFVEGHIKRPKVEEKLTVRLSAEGYEPKTLALPIRSGQTTYAVDLLLEKK
ncbi:MAG: alpha/beta fold hydrolase [Planctomycetes bacterium]|nr:alpha/beta fold hydrolase [Planctomycetota bacterium]